MTENTKQPLTVEEIKELVMVQFASLINKNENGESVIDLTVTPAADFIIGVVGALSDTYIQLSGEEMDYLAASYRANEMFARYIAELNVRNEMEQFVRGLAEQAAPVEEVERVEAEIVE